MSYSFEPIGIVHSPFQEKFGIPRQPGLVASARGQIELLAPYNRPEAVKGLEQFSHLWVLFLFHAVNSESWTPTVRPPRLGGNERVGVFASRSTHRPNGTGLSVVELERVDTSAGKVVLHIAGLDLLNGTPVIDIKPYIPYSDAIADARGGFAPQPPSQKPVVLSEAVRQAISELENERRPGLLALIEELLRYDHRPGYRKEEAEEREYGMALFDLNVRWRHRKDDVEVVAVELASPR